MDGKNYQRIYREKLNSCKGEDEVVFLRSHWLQMMIPEVMKDQVPFHQHQKKQEGSLGRYNR